MTTAMYRGSTDHTLSPISRLPVTIAAIFGSMALLVGFLFIDTSRLPDYGNYYSWADELQSLSWHDFELREVISFALLKLFGSFGNSVHQGLTAFYLLNLFIATFGLLAISVKYARSGLGVIIVYALYGPLLAYITLRATMAYILVSWAFLMNGTWFRRILISCFASAFHVTALIPSAAIAGAALSGTTCTQAQMHASRHRVLLLFFMLVAAFFAQVAWLQGWGDSAALSIVSLIPSASRFSEYFAAAAQFRSPAHVAYFAFVLTFVSSYLYITRNARDHSWCLIYTSLFLFLCLSISPVAAFRFSIFIMIPIILRYPVPRTSTQLAACLIGAIAAFSIGAYQALNLFSQNNSL